MAATLDPYQVETALIAVHRVASGREKTSSHERQFASTCRTESRHNDRNAVLADALWAHPGCHPGRTSASLHRAHASLTMADEARPQRVGSKIEETSAGRRWSRRRRLAIAIAHGA